MIRLVTPSSVGLALRQGRVAAYLSQEKLAKITSIDRKTISRLEQGHGYLSSLNRVAKALGLELRVRGFPHAPVGAALKAVRQRRYITATALASMLEISQSTLRRLEKSSSVRLDTIEAASQLLGIALYLAPSRART